MTSCVLTCEYCNAKVKRFTYYIVEVKGAMALSSAKELNLENVGQPIVDPMKDLLEQGEERKVSFGQAYKKDAELFTLGNGSLK